ncbi:Uncharacterised protein [Acinetobacter baumannii]|nr:Uncharacterised protein [Acinetobacter baumannii]
MAGERHDQPVAFGVRDKDIRGNAALDRVLPADQRFQPADAVAAVIFDEELVALDAAQQRALRALPQQQHVVAEHADHQRQHQAAQQRQANIVGRQFLVVEQDAQRQIGQRQGVRLVLRQLRDRHQVRAEGGQRAVAHHDGDARRLLVMRSEQQVGHQIDVQRGEDAGRRCARMPQPNRDRRLVRYDRRALLQLQIQRQVGIDVLIHVFHRQHHIAGGGGAVGVTVFHQQEGAHAAGKGRLIGDVRLA